MNINSPIFVPHLSPIPPQLPPSMHVVKSSSINIATTIPKKDCKNIFGSSPPTHVGDWNYMLSSNINVNVSQLSMHFYQQQMLNMRHQQLHNFNMQINNIIQQENFFNANYHIQQLVNMSFLPQQQFQQQTLQKQQQQQDVHYRQQQNTKHKLQQQQKTKLAPTKTCERTVKSIKKVSKPLKTNSTLPTQIKTTATTSIAEATKKVLTPVDTEMQTMKYDTMQHHSNTAGQVNSNSSNGDTLQVQQLNGNSKHDSYGTGHYHHNNQQHQHHNHGNHQQHGNRQRKPRNNNNHHHQKRQYNHMGGQKQHNPTNLNVENWLGNNMDYCYEERRYNSSSLYAEDNTTPRHNPQHRNSNASETTGSDEAPIAFSSNEDLIGDCQSNLKSNKKNKYRQKRQQKNKQFNKNRNSNNGSVDQANFKKEIPMDIEEETKENHRQAYGGNIMSNPPQQQQQQNLRKQCTKTAALKSANKNKHNNHNGNAVVNQLTTSQSNNSVCSAMSARSLPSSISSSASNSPTGSPTVTKRNAQNYKRIALALTPPQIDHMNSAISEQEVVDVLQNYVVKNDLLRVYGYPIESATYPGCIEIYKILHKPAVKKKDGENRGYTYDAGSNIINSNDGLHVSCLDSEKNYPGYIDAHSSSDSGQGSGESSPLSMDSDASENCEDDTPDGNYQIFAEYDQSLKKECIRCTSEFHVTEAGKYLNTEECVYHWGKIDNIYVGGGGICPTYTCCRRVHTDKGCTKNRLHVWSGAVMGVNGPYTDYVYTRPNDDPNSEAKVYALDCEMSFTGRGLELTKVTVVGYNGSLVYEHFVRPEAEIVDYNTRFSGITEEDLAHSNKSVKTLPEVQQDLLKLFDANTLLIGHALDNDLRALRMVHKNIVDTSIAFPHPSGFPFRRSLKFLTKSWLGRDIQGGEVGHDSYEDSLACLELMRWRIFNEEVYAGATQAMLQRHYAMSQRC